MPKGKAPVQKWGIGHGDDKHDLNLLGEKYGWTVKGKAPKPIEILDKDSKPVGKFELYDKHIHTATKIVDKLREAFPEFAKDYPEAEAGAVKSSRVRSGLPREKYEAELAELSLEELEARQANHAAAIEARKEGAKLSNFAVEVQELAQKRGVKLGRPGVIRKLAALLKEGTKAGKPKS